VNVRRRPHHPRRKQPEPSRAVSEKSLNTGCRLVHTEPTPDRRSAPADCCSRPSTRLGRVVAPPEPVSGERSGSRGSQQPMANVG
jgi:hypothetical protein